MNDKIKIHFIYTSGILIFIIIGLLVKKIGPDSGVVSHISFASSIASILLAIIAIIHAIVSNTSLNQSVGLINTSANKLQSASDSLGSIASEIENSISRISKQVHETHGLVSNLANASSKKELEKLPIAKNLVELHEQLIRRGSYNGDIAIYCMLKAFNEKKGFDKNQLFSKIEKGNELYYYGYIVCLLSTGVFSYTFEKTIITVKEFNEQFKTIASTHFDKIKRGDSSYGVPKEKCDWYKEKFSIIDNYFSGEVA